MAAITSANVVVTRQWMARDAGGAEVEVVKDLVITLSAQGGTAADIPASALGLALIKSCHPHILDVSGTPKLATVGVAKDGSELVPADVNQATDANRTGRANLTGDLYIRVTGSPAL
jgi:hypothetical protein